MRKLVKELEALEATLKSQSGDIARKYKKTQEIEKKDALFRKLCQNFQAEKVIKESINKIIAIK